MAWHTKTSVYSQTVRLGAEAWPKYWCIEKDVEGFYAVLRANYTPAERLINPATTVGRGYTSFEEAFRVLRHDMENWIAETAKYYHT